MASTPPAPSWPQMSLPQLQAANDDNEGIFLRNVHLENSPVCRPGQLLGYRSWEGRRRGESGKVGTRRTARMGPLGMGEAVWGLPCLCLGHMQPMGTEKRGLAARPTGSLVGG